MSDEQEHIRFSRVAANAMQAAMRVTRDEMPEASEKRRLLLVLANAAASCGILRIDVDAVMKLVAGAYKQGLEVAPPAGALFES
jgi:methanogenic corrinoid protein MtbC1